MVESGFEVFRGGRALVTGGAGFIGSHIVRWLLDLGSEVVVLDDLSTGYAANLDGAGAELRVGSILEEDLLREATAGCRFVFHEAAMVSVPQSVDEPEQCVRVNIEGTWRVLDAARDAGVRRVVFASSAAVYGPNPRLPSRETDPVDCVSPYAASKAAGEAAISAYGSCYDVSTVSLRYFNVFGPRQDPKSAYAAVIAAFLDALQAGKTPTIFGDGGQTRDFVAIENVVAANLLAAASPRDLTGETINIGTGVRTSLLDLLAALATRLGVDVAPVFAADRAGDVRDSVADIGRARELLGYDPRVDLTAGLAAFFDG